MEIFDEQLDLKLKTEIESKSPESILSEVFTLTNIQYQKSKLSFFESLYKKYFKVDLKQKYKENAIHQIKHIKLTHGLFHFSDNFDDKYLKSTFEIKQLFKIIGWGYLIVGVIFSLIYIMNGYSIFLADKNELYKSGVLTLNYFSENMIGAAKSILFCILALTVSKILKKFLGLHHIEVVCDRIEDNINLNDKSQRRKVNVDTTPPKLVKQG